MASHRCSQATRPRCWPPTGGASLRHPALLIVMRLARNCSALFSSSSSSSWPNLTSHVPSSTSPMPRCSSHVCPYAGPASLTQLRTQHECAPADSVGAGAAARAAVATRLSLSCRASQVSNRQGRRGPGLACLCRGGALLSSGQPAAVGKGQCRTRAQSPEPTQHRTLGPTVAR